MRFITIFIAIALISCSTFAGTKARWKAGHLEYYESITQETVQVLAPRFYEVPTTSAILNVLASTDTTEVGSIRSKITGTAYVQWAYSEDGGGLIVTLDDANAKGEAVLYQLDNKQFNANNNLAFEFYGQVSHIPEATGTCEVGFGLAGSYAEGIASTYQILVYQDYADTNFQFMVCDANGTTTVDTGIPVVAGVDHVFRVECYDVDNVVLWIDGNAVATTDFDATDANATMQVFAGVYKPGSTGIGGLKFKSIKVWSDR